MRRTCPARTRPGTSDARVLPESGRGRASPPAGPSPCRAARRQRPCRSPRGPSTECRGTRARRGGVVTDPRVQRLRTGDPGQPGPAAAAAQGPGRREGSQASAKCTGRRGAGWRAGLRGDWRPGPPAARRGADSVKKGQRGRRGWAAWPAPAARGAPVCRLRWPWAKYGCFPGPRRGPRSSRRPSLGAGAGRGAGARGGRPASLLRAASQVFGPGRGALRGQCREDAWEGGAFGKALCQ